jgi:hypothetical protein
MPDLNSILRPKLLTLALWATAFLIWLTFIGQPIPLPLFGKSQHHSVGGAFNLATGPLPVSLKEHPIKAFHRQAEVNFGKLLARQSKTFEAAASDYIRRYHKPPPPGFEIWYEFAVKHNSSIIDDFDIINESLAPFWSLSGAEVKRRLANVRENGPAVQHCEFVSRNVSEGCQELGPEILTLLEEAGVWSRLEGLELLVNEMDEPRVLSGGVDDKPVSGGKIFWANQSHSRVWNDVTAACDYSAHSAIDNKGQALTLGLFEDGKSNALDLCQHPEYSHMHGFWDSPATLYTTRTAVPILSPAILSTMGDIPIPAAVYTDESFAYNETEDVAWEKKTAGLYWAGKTTGSFQGRVGQDWKNHHRQRFVALTNGLEPKKHTYLARSGHDGAEWQAHKSRVLKHSLYNVHFTDVVQLADDATNASVRAYFDIHPAAPSNESFKYTLNFDLDGNGHSGRFYRLLNSASLPLKQTVFREWHDERLQPWLHYVPVSLGMKELPEVVRYLADEEEGRQVAALMAGKGREWSRRALRPVDQAIYLYRLMLELARLQDPGRPHAAH